MTRKGLILAYNQGMTSQSTQLRITLPTELQSLLKIRASKLGLNMSAYVKNLIINDVKDMDSPDATTLDQTTEAIAKRKKAAEIQNLKDFFKHF